MLYVQTAGHLERRHGTGRQRNGIKAFGGTFSLVVNP
jgi:hypothetical protein